MAFEWHAHHPLISENRRLRVYFSGLVNVLAGESRQASVIKHGVRVG